MFVKKNDTVNVSVYVYELDGIQATPIKTEIPESVGDAFKEAVFKFKMANYGESNSILRVAQHGATVESAVNAIDFQMRFLSELLVDWDLEDNGKKVIVSPTAIGNLHPAIARSAVAGALQLIKI